MGPFEFASDSPFVAVGITWFLGEGILALIKVSPWGAILVSCVLILTLGGLQFHANRKLRPKDAS